MSEQSEWTSKYAIMRDLAEAQGFNVPAELEGVGANEKPPALNIPEETGEDYFGPHNEGEGDCAGPPDLALIQHMLNLVRDIDISNLEDEPKETEVVQISKPTHMNIGKDITNTRTGTIPKTVQKNVQPQPKKVKKKRENVAVNSILQAMAGDTPISNMEYPNEPLILLKPTDFISETADPEIVESVQKVNGWLDSQMASTSVSRFSGNPLILEPGSMFKRKSSSNVKSPGSDGVKSPKKQPSILPGDTQEPSSSNSRISSYPLALEPVSMFKRKSGSSVKSPESSKKTSPVKQQVTTKIESYKPSMLANEYYQKYVERSKLKELVNDDIWTSAERKMKEIDAQKKQQAEEAAALKAALLESTTNVSAIDAAATDDGTIDTATTEDASIDTAVARETKIPDTMEFLQIERSSPNRDSPIPHFQIYCMQ
ncbi:hypothetical protein ABMA27_014997 [Loxostege sticticalis]|uniref:Uncharacterized protein n=1 Tax=Loxostege sticticalis TaxID=481309 RepID=A0ABR3IAY0_LOXSC